MELLKLLSASEIAAQIISFLILLFILRKFAWKRILSLLDQRSEKIAAELQSAETANLEIKQLKAEYEAQVHSIDLLANEKIKEAVSEGRKITEEIKKKAQAEAREILEAADEDIRQEIRKAKEELKTHIVELTISATENIIEKKLTAKDERKLVEDFLESMDKLRLS